MLSAVWINDELERGELGPGFSKKRSNEFGVGTVHADSDKPIETIRSF